MSQESGRKLECRGESWNSYELTEVGQRGVRYGYNPTMPIGKGSYGTVFSASEIDEHGLALGRDWALKFFLPVEDEPLAGFRVVNEIEAGYHLRDHPHLCGTHDIICTRDEEGKITSLAMVSQLAEGDLTHRNSLHFGHLVSPSQILDYHFYWFVEVAAGLHGMHQRGLVHGDVKGANVLLSNTPSGPFMSAKLSDFGLVAPIGFDMDYDLYPVTVRPFEMLLGSRRVEAAGDVWALGCLLVSLFEPSCPAGPFPPRGVPMPTADDDVVEFARVVVSVLGTPTFQQWMKAKEGLLASGADEIKVQELELKLLAEMDQFEDDPDLLKGLNFPSEESMDAMWMCSSGSPESRNARRLAISMLQLDPRRRITLGRFFAQPRYTQTDLFLGPPESERVNACNCFRLVLSELPMETDPGFSDALSMRVAKVEAAIRAEHGPPSPPPAAANTEEGEVGMPPCSPDGSDIDIPPRNLERFASPASPASPPKKKERKPPAKAAGPTRTKRNPKAAARRATPPGSKRNAAKPKVAKAK